MSKRVVLLGMDGVIATSILGTADLFDVANLIGRRIGGQEDLFQVLRVSPNGQAFRCSNGVEIGVDGDLSRVQPGDILFTPAYRVSRGSDVDPLLSRWQAVGPWLHQVQASLELLVAHCSGVFMLAEAGVLDGGRATTAWWLHSALGRRYPAVSVETDDVWVQWRNILTGAATSAFYDITLQVIERYAGKHFARLLAKYMMLDNQRASQAPYAILPAGEIDDPLMNRAEQWLRANLQREFRVEELADAMAVSPRTLIRRFQKHLGESPQSYTQKIRIEKSKILLETTRLRLSEVVARCGYNDESAFRRLFKRYCGVSPGEYRRRFASR